jgi:hypothetical protein
VLRVTPRPSAAAAARAAARRPIALAAAGATETDAATAAAGGGTAGALMNTGDGRQVLVFMMECSDESVACYLLGHIGLTWVMQNIIPGQRKALLTLHVSVGSIGI